MSNEHSESSLNEHDFVEGRPLLIPQERAMLSQVQLSLGRVFTFAGNLPEPLVRVNRYWVAKWLLYTLAKEDAIEVTRENLAEVDREVARLMALKPDAHNRVPVHEGSGIKDDRDDLLRNCEEERAEFLAHTMEDQRRVEQECAADDRDSFFDEDLFDAGKRWDPDYNKPVLGTTGEG